MPVPIHGFQFSRCCVIMNENCFHPAFRVLHQTHLDYYTETFPIKTEHFSCWIFLHLISTLPPLYSGVTCNRDSRERCTGPNNNSFIFPSLALPSPAPHVRRRDAQRLISTFATSEWIVSSASPCVSLGVWLIISTACVSAGSSVLLLSDWTRTKWTQRPENTVELVFFVGIYKGSYLVLFFLILLITNFNSLILYSPSSSAIQSLWT